MNNINCNTNYNIYKKNNSMFNINDINYKKIIIFISQIIIFLILLILIIIKIIIFRIQIIIIFIILIIVLNLSCQSFDSNKCF
jgi:glucan phosphoethanolaminetransferase (alkaline phosphatase superfamily)